LAPDGEAGMTNINQEAVMSELSEVAEQRLAELQKEAAEWRVSYAAAMRQGRPDEGTHHEIFGNVIRRGELSVDFHAVVHARRITFDVRTCGISDWDVESPQERLTPEQYEAAKEAACALGDLARALDPPTEAEIHELD